VRSRPRHCGEALRASSATLPPSDEKLNQANQHELSEETNLEITSESDDDAVRCQNLNDYCRRHTDIHEGETSAHQRPRRPSRSPPRWSHSVRCWRLHHLPFLPVTWTGWASRTSRAYFGARFISPQSHGDSLVSLSRVSGPGHGSQVNERVIRHDRDCDVHPHEDENCFRWRTLIPDQGVGQKQDNCHRNGDAVEKPSGTRSNPRHNRPPHTRDDHSDDRQLGVVRKLKMSITLGRGIDFCA